MINRAGVLLAVCVGAASLLGEGGAAAAGPLVDVAAAVAPRPEVGDFKVYAGDAGPLRIEVEAVTDLPSGWSAQERITCATGGALVVEESAAAADGTAVRVLDGTGGPMECPDLLGALIDSHRSFPLAMRTGARLRFKYEDFGGFASLIDSKVRGYRMLAGSAVLDTPYASHGAALRILTHSSVKSSGPLGFPPPGADGRVTTMRRASWFVEGVGLVGEATTIRSYRFGQLRKASSSEFWLRQGVIGGVPYPPPD